MELQNFYPQPVIFFSAVFSIAFPLLAHPLRFFFVGILLCNQFALPFVVSFITIRGKLFVTEAALSLLIKR